MSPNPSPGQALLSRLVCLLLAVVACAPTARSDGAISAAASVTGAQHDRTADDRAALVERLDAIVREAVAREPLAGVSVAVLRGQDTLLRRGYGYADLGLRVLASEETTYRFLGPMLGAAIMQQVERGRLRLDDDASRLLPEFPWQGRHVTVRQLMDATSGLPDYHYLGDPQRAQRAVPKAHDEVTALFAGRPFMHEPGERSQWTISGFHLAGILLERVTGQSYPDYLREHIFNRAGLTRSFYCDDRSVVPGLARAYEALGRNFYNFPPESATLYPFIATVCTSAGDAASLIRALRDGRLLRPESYRAMMTARGTAKEASPQMSRGVGLRENQEEGHRWVGVSGSLMGFSSAVMDFPADSLTIAVLSNTSGQAALRVARSLARAALGLPRLPAPARREEAPPAEKVALSAVERARYVGTYRIKWAGVPGPLQNFQRTYRVFEQNGRLMIQALGEEPEPLLHEGADTFRIASWPSARIVFTLREGRAVSMTLRESGERGLSGPRVDEAWPNKPYPNR